MPTLEKIEKEVKQLPKADQEALRDWLENELELSNGVDLRMHGIDETHAAELRSRLKTFAEDWQRPEADIYDQDLAR